MGHLLFEAGLSGQGSRSGPRHAPVLGTLPDSTNRSATQFLPRGGHDWEATVDHPDHLEDQLADMEGPTVKRILWRIGSPRLRRVPEGNGAQRRMRRLRRRIRLICADCPEGPSRMTVVRRELPPSRSASRPTVQSRRRIASARALQSCPHHAGAAVPQEAEHGWSSLLASPAYAAPARCVIAAQRKPTNSRATATTAIGGRLPCPTRWR